MLLDNPKISTLVAMTKVFAPLSPKKNRELLRMLSTASQFDALPEWVVMHLNQVEHLLEADKASVAKHLAGQHDQASHGQRASAESPSFTEKEAKAISTYSNREALDINRNLRGQTKGYRPTVFDMRPEAVEEAVKNLDSAIGKSKLTQKLTLEREIPIDSLKNGLFKSAVGKVISDKGYLSMKKGTSSLPNRNGFIRLRVIADVGTNALDLSFINPNAMSEVIFPRDSKIKITSISGSGENAMVRGEIVG